MATKKWVQENPEKVKEYQRRWYAKNKKRAQTWVSKRKQRLLAWMREYKATLSCQVCGESHPACLVFHHRNPAEKEVEIARIIYVKGWGKERILAEIARCDVLCANCHRKLHWDEKP